MQVACENLAIQTPNDPNPLSFPIGDPPPPATVAVLDSGTSDIYLPFDQWEFLSLKAGLFTIGSEQVLRVDCTAKGCAGGVDFAFSVFTVHVPFYNLVEQYDVGKCSFKVLPSDTAYILGANFLS